MASAALNFCESARELKAALATNDFRIVSIEVADDGTNVEWEPKENRWTGAEIQAVLKGAESLDGEWKAVEGATAAEKAVMRSFKVVVGGSRWHGGSPHHCKAEAALPHLYGSPHRRPLFD